MLLLRRFLNTAARRAHTMPTALLPRHAAVRSLVLVRSTLPATFTPTFATTTRAFSSASPQIPPHILKAIKSTLEKYPVVLFMKGNPDQPMCGFSRFAVQLLDLHGANFTTVDILKDSELRENMKVYANWPTFPQLFIKGELVGGADILRGMHESGELKTALEAAGALPPSGDTNE